MIELNELITQVVALNKGKKIVGKTRLQKTLYLLDQCGLGTDCRYEYRYYGPFSAQIAEAAEDAYALGWLEYDEQPGYHRVPYGVYELKESEFEIPQNVGGLPRDVVSRKLSIMDQHSAVELELAATLHYLAAAGQKDPINMLRSLKPAKSSPERIEGAVKLLKELRIEF